MTLRTKLIAGTLTAAGLVAAAALAGYFFVFQSDAPAPVSIADAADQAAMTPETGTTPSGELDPVGEWTLVQGEPSFVGYRVDQQLAGIGSETVVGRTQSVEGSLNFDGTTITDAQVVADMTGLQSGESLRDGQLRSQAIESGEFPTATFALTEPIVVSQVPAEGESTMQTVSGDLTLHGVSQPVQVDMEAVMQGGRLIVVGSHEIQFADYGITPPTGPASVLSVEDNGIMEVQLVFEKGASEGTPPPTPSPANDQSPAQPSY